MSSSKLQFVDGMRGLAACQVVLLHYCAAFLPATARVGDYTHYAWEPTLGHSPLFALIDGYSAVYLFFVMSGFVLAPSFLQSQQPFYRLAIKRYLRLYVPVGIAFVIALGLTLSAPSAKSNAAAISHSNWLNSLGQNPLNSGSLIRDGLLNPLLAGYRGSSVFDSLPLHLLLQPAPVTSALNPPMWTLHVEFWGSMLVLFLAFMQRRVSNRGFWCIFAAIFFVTGTSHFSLFLLGYLLHQFRTPLLSIRNSGLAVFGAALTLAGLYVCVGKNISGLSQLLLTLNKITFASATSDFHWQSQSGAALVFIGAMLNEPLRKFTSRGPILWLGKISFSLYLLHFPIMMTLGCAIFAWLAPASYLLGCAVATIVGVTVTVLAAALFEKYIDRNGIRLSKRACKEDLPRPVNAICGAAPRVIPRMTTP